MDMWSLDILMMMVCYCGKSVFMGLCTFVIWWNKIGYSEIVLNNALDVGVYGYNQFAGEEVFSWIVYAEK
jgi:hypothetical protein